MKMALSYKIPNLQNCFGVTIMLVALFCHLQLTLGATQAKEDIEEFKNLFAQKRMLQLQAVKKMMTDFSPEKQEKILKPMIEQMINILTKSRTNIESSGYLVGGEFPKETQVRELLALIMENTCLLSDILLRFPDFVHEQFDLKREWEHMYKWCLGFVSETNLIDEFTAKTLYLASQEIGLIEKDPLYQNPYKIERKKTPRFADPPEKPKKKEKKKLQRGPRLSKEL